MSAAWELRDRTEAALQKKKSAQRDLGIALKYSAWCEQEGMAPWPVGYDSASGYLCMFVLKVEGSSKSIDAIIHALKVKKTKVCMKGVG